jgi:hypothetical protein
MNAHLRAFFDRVKKANDDILNDPNRDAKQDKQNRYEYFDKPAFTSMYEELMQLVKVFVELEEEKARKQKLLGKQQDKLTQTNKVLKEQQKLGFDGDADDDSIESDIRKLYKTIMCPLKTDCPKVKMLRWPSSSVKSNTKFGKDCPYAHHPMEL